MPQHHWESDTPSYKIRTTVNGDKATLYFECHYIDVKTGKVDGRRRRRPQRAEDQREVADRRLGRSAATLSARRVAMARPEVLERRPPPEVGGAGADNRLVRLVARVPATVRTKLLVAFLAIAALLVLVGVLGLRCSGRRTRA